MKKVKWHVKAKDVRFYDIKNIDREFEKIEKYKLNSNTNQLNFNLFAFNKKMMFNLQDNCILNTPYRIKESLHLALDFGLSHFQRMEGKVPYLFIEGQRFENTPASGNESEGFPEWYVLLIHLFLARDYERKQDILDFKIMDLDIKSNSVSKIGIPLILSIYNNDSKTLETKYEAFKKRIETGMTTFYGIDGTREIYSKEFVDAAQVNVMPIIDLLRYAFYKKEEEYNSTLEKYLINKKKRIIKKRETDHPRYYIDFLALGVCAYAYDQGLDIQVESEYIPAWVYRGEFE